MDKPWKWELAAGLFAGITLAILIAIYVVAASVVPRYQLEQLRQGMSKSEVRAILGKPTFVEGDREWVYRRWGNPGWVEVYFDEEGLFDHVNDESPFR